MLHDDGCTRYSGGMFMQILRYRRFFGLICTAFGVVLFGCVAIGAFGANYATDPASTLNPQPVRLSQDVNELRWDLAERFTFSWESVELAAKVMNSAGEVASQSNTPEQSITISVDVDWNPLEAEGLVIIDVNGPQVYEFLDGEGNTIEYENAESDQYRCYDDTNWYWVQNRRAYVSTTRYEPFNVKIRLPADVNGPAPSMISVLKGYIWAIYADAVIEVDVPFDPNLGDFKSVLAPELTFTVDITTPPVPEPLEYICVVPSEVRGGGQYRPKRAVGLYRYATWVKSKTNQAVLGLNDGIRYPGSVYVFQDYAVIRTKLRDSTGGDVMQVNNQIVENRFATTRGAYCWGQLEQDRNSYDMICHIIAVHPVEVKIPFVLTNIPVPSVQPTGDKGQ